MDGSRRRTPFTMALLRSASARNRTFTTGEPSAAHPERASVSREGRQVAPADVYCSRMIIQTAKAILQEWRLSVRKRSALVTKLSGL